MAPRRRTQDAGRRTGSDGPPSLDLDIVARIKGLLLANGLAILVLGICAYLLATGRIALRPEAQEGLVPLAVMIGACVVLVLSCWFLLPVSTWLRAWPRWHYHHGNKVLWALPYALGAIARFLLRLVAGLAAIAGVVLVGLGLWRLFEIFQSAN